MEPNPFDAAWELRLGTLRALYDVDGAQMTVTVLRAGYKVGNDLYLRGLHTPLRTQEDGR
jgi:hypothetical protein